MPVSEVLMYLAPAALALWVFFTASHRERRNISQHPETLPLIGCMYATAVNASRHYEWQTDQCARMRGQPWLIKIPGRPLGIVVASPELIEDVLQTQAEAFGKGVYLRENLRELFGDGIFAVDGHQWVRQRKTASNLFSMRALRDFMAVVVHEDLDTLHAILDCASSSRESLDLSQLLNRFTLEVFAEIAFGVKLGTLGTEEEQPFERAFNGVQKTLFVRFLQPMWLWKLQRWLCLGTERETQTQMQTINDTVYSVISRSLAQEQAAGTANGTESDEPQQHSIISLFLNGVSDDDAKVGDAFDPTLLRDIVVNFLVAGRDTTAQALSWFFYCLTQHPDVEAKVRAEMVAKLPDVLSANIAKPSMSQVHTLVYLEAVLKETLRLYPSVPSNIREALRDVVLCDGTRIKAGELVGIPSYVLGRMAHVWGPDAMDFRPERWLDAKTGGLLVVSPYKFNVFNAGPRMCLGVKLAMMEMKMVATSVLSKYTFTAVPGEEVNYGLGLTLAMKDGFKVTVSKVKPALS